MSWQTARLKYITRLGYGDTLPLDEPHEGPFQVFGSNGPYARLGRANAGPPAIIVGRKGSYGKVNWSGAKCFASDTTYFVDPSTTRHSLRWVFWVLQTLSLDEGSNEAAVPGLNRETAYEQIVPLPSYDQQFVIAEYLDLATARLDDLIEAKEHLMQLIAEKRRALITHAVTRGLDPNAPLRDSGLPWLGQIPAHWETRRCAWLFSERDERGEPDLPLLEVSINSGVVMREFADDRIESTAADFNSYKVARKGDLVFNRMRMWQGAVGIAPVDGLVSPDYAVAVIDNQLAPQYTACLMRTAVFSAECARESHGITWDRLRLYWEGFREIRIPLPARNEQHDIITWVQTETAKLDALRTAAERTIALLKERRAALIAAAVTGQLNIPEAA